MSISIRSIFVFAALSFVCLCAAQAAADVPRYITFQGRLTGVSDGDVDMIVTFWDAETGGTMLFLDSHADVPVTNGVFSLMIGEGQNQYSVPNGGVPDSAIDAAAVWVELFANDGLNPVVLSRTRLVSLPYSIKADAAERLVKPGTFENALTVDGTSGYVGIGTDAPVYGLHVKGDGGAGLIKVERTGQEIVLNPNNNPGGYAQIVTQPVGTVDFSISTTEDPARFYMSSDTGYIGIGTDSPEYGLHVKGDGGAGLIEVERSGQQIVLNPNYNPGGFAQILARPAGTVDFSISTTGDPDNFYMEHANGFIGIGTTDPACALHVSGNGIAGIVQVERGGKGVVINPNYGQHDVYAIMGGRLQDAMDLAISPSETPSHFYIKHNGDIGIGTTNPACRLDVAGTTRTEVLQITGGADLAEKFPVSETVQPGMVVAIDPQNAGRLCLARGAYNRCVAGVVSGAGNLPAGAVLGNFPGAADAPAVALTGRVWVWCDASTSPIVPGDMLTTSDTPGHAMKAVDVAKSHGAVIGKAMTGLEEGAGLVLVLVSLQ